uniref:WDHD1 first WD40 domain-containing protein n=1 Tax=Rhizochromulina marina TaxID=1034831 RepID=A0A6U0WHT4_9STRA|mmetsp:Transcript_11027/g.31634  ORF Transcript_11027/g.31634 Transcript_11027/m.31634 type:complete len:273 (+) Transcript_11027:1855-2673(+)
MDGMARIWGKDGRLRHTLSGHCEAIFSMRFNQAGSLLLTGSYDFSTVVWDVNTGKPRQRYQVHSRQVLDVDWKDNETFASCSSDKTIHVCKLGQENPICMFQGHKDEVNAVKWDPSGKILASCSDDHTAKIWVMDQTKYVHDLREHSKEIYTIRWSPTGPGSDHPNKKLMLASASFDSMVKLWDVETGTRLHNLNRHDKKVYTVAFSPDGEYLASGSLGGQLYVWSVKDGSIVKSFRGDADIYDVAWNSSGNKIACCGATESNAVTIIDFRM